MHIIILNPSGQINNRRIRKACYNKDYIAGNADPNHGLHIIHSPKGAETVQYRIQQLGNQRGAIISQPQKSHRIPALFFCKLPPFMVGPDVKALADRVHQKADDHQPGSVAENQLKAASRPVAFRRRVQQPQLGNHNKRH